MATVFKFGDLVWVKNSKTKASKQKWWPGKLVKARDDIKKPGGKGNYKFVYLYGSKNYAWVSKNNLCSYVELRNKYKASTCVPKHFNKALEEIESEHQAILASGSIEDLSSDKEVTLKPQKSVTGDSKASPSSSVKKRKTVCKEDLNGATMQPSSSNTSETPSPPKKFFVSKDATPSSHVETPKTNESSGESQHYSDTLCVADTSFAEMLDKFEPLETDEKASGSIEDLSSDKEVTLKPQKSVTGDSKASPSSSVKKRKTVCKEDLNGATMQPSSSNTSETPSPPKKFFVSKDATPSSHVETPKTNESSGESRHYSDTLCVADTSFAEMLDKFEPLETDEKADLVNRDSPEQTNSSFK